jgi:hypothetical protein
MNQHSLITGSTNNALQNTYAGISLNEFAISRRVLMRRGIMKSRHIFRKPG